MGNLSYYFKLLRKMPGNIQALKANSEVVPGYDLKNPKVLLGRMLAEMNSKKPTIQNLSEVEFQVFSQWGDDGILQYLISKLDIPQKTFIEFGVENYTESNTRFLLINNNWCGLVMDGSKTNMDYVKNDLISWAHEIYAEAVFITKDNINDQISAFLKKGFSRELGLLSIDIDGNDYWIWDAIDTVDPIIVVAEYNSLFGFDKPYTTPYQEDFYRLQKGNIILNYGASLLSLCDLAEVKGYDFIGCNSAGNNAYFIRRDKNSNMFKKLTAEQGYVKSRFSEMCYPDGSRIMGDERLKQLKGCKVFNTRTKSIESI